MKTLEINNLMKKNSFLKICLLTSTLINVKFKFANHSIHRASLHNNLLDWMLPSVVLGQVISHVKRIALKRFCRMITYPFGYTFR